MANQTLIGVLAQAVSVQEWVFIESVSTEPSWDVYIEGDYNGVAASLVALESAYPAASQTNGDIGVVYDTPNVELFHIFEKQTS